MVLNSFIKLCFITTVESFKQEKYSWLYKRLFLTIVSWRILLPSNFFVSNIIISNGHIEDTYHKRYIIDISSNWRVTISIRIILFWLRIRRGYVTFMEGLTLKLQLLLRGDYIIITIFNSKKLRLLHLEMMNIMDHPQNILLIYLLRIYLEIK